MRLSRLFVIYFLVFLSNAASPVFSSRNNNQFQDHRPPIQNRTFVSPVIEQLIKNISSQMKDPDLALLFIDCLPNTLDTTVLHFTPNFNQTNKPDTFIITGDIQAMWLRDSTNQIWPYLPYATKDPNLQNLIRGLINRQIRSVLIDQYANAFNYQDEGSPWQTDVRKPKMNKKLWEGKYELDSLLAVIRLSVGYYYYTNDLSCFDEQWKQAMLLIQQTIRYQQIGTLEEINNPQYMFQRQTFEPTDTLMHGVGVPARRCGLSKSHFRPSDDAASMPYSIPANSFAVVSLRNLSQLWMKLQQPSAAKDALELANELNAGIINYGLVNQPIFVNNTRTVVQIYAYEVDGFGSHYCMDDANIPSLLSLPYLGYCDKQDPLYQRTRNYLLSNNNPFYFSGTAGAGIGGPHNGVGYIWMMSIIMQALTSQNDQEILQCLQMLKTTSVNTGFMHESFWMNDATKYTRSWFAWANSLFGELILVLAKEKPYLIFK